MKRAIVRAAIGGAAATGLLALALVVGRAPADRLLQAYVLALGALTLSVLVLAARPPDALRRGASPFELALRTRPSAQKRPAALERVEREVALALGSDFYLHARLRPLVTRIAADRLLERRGIDLERDPERASAALEPEIWALVRPDREEPRQRDAGSLDLRQLTAIVDALERV